MLRSVLLFSPLLATSFLLPTSAQAFDCGAYVDDGKLMCRAMIDFGSSGATVKPTVDKTLCGRMESAMSKALCFGAAELTSSCKANLDSYSSTDQSNACKSFEDLGKDMRGGVRSAAACSLDGDDEILDNFCEAQTDLTEAKCNSIPDKAVQLQCRKVVAFFKDFWAEHEKGTFEDISELEQEVEEEEETPTPRLTPVVRPEPIFDEEIEREAAELAASRPPIVRTPSDLQMEQLERELSQLEQTPKRKVFRWRKFVRNVKWRVEALIDGVKTARVLAQADDAAMSEAQVTAITETIADDMDKVIDEFNDLIQDNEDLGKRLEDGLSLNEEAELEKELRRMQTSEPSLVVHETKLSVALGPKWTEIQEKEESEDQQEEKEDKILILLQ
jgi:hypothetical protein